MKSTKAFFATRCIAPMTETADWLRDVALSPAAANALGHQAVVRVFAPVEQSDAAQLRTEELVRQYDRQFREALLEECRAGLDLLVGEPGSSVMPLLSVLLAIQANICDLAIFERVAASLLSAAGVDRDRVIGDAERVVPSNRETCDSPRPGQVGETQGKDAKEPPSGVRNSSNDHNFSATGDRS
jgi:hypothetical protein